MRSLPLCRKHQSAVTCLLFAALAGLFAGGSTRTEAGRQRVQPLPRPVPGAAAPADIAQDRGSSRHPMPAPSVMRSGARQRLNRNAAPDGLAPRRLFEDVDLTEEANDPGRVASGPPAAVVASLTELLSGARAARKLGPGPDPKPLLDAPWSANHLLADATHMNDEYVSIAANPVNGNLYATFEATDLGGTDRDIHIAKSTDAGATWQVWEMPSYSQDEYHSELAIDAAGYLFVTWIRADGYILRSKSTNPDSPLTWAWVRGLSTGEPCATPSIAVSGSGASAKVFIASAWNTLNADLYAYEWTLIWMYSTNAGSTITYDYFTPDGYQDYWPDVAMNGNTVYFMNAEQDYDTGEMEILIDADALNGGFSSPSSLSAWTNMDCKFPRLAADGANVYTVFQLEFDDGQGNIDGDIVYCFSWDGLATLYGPYDMVADANESLGPTIYTRNGIVGCLWLDAPPGGDEFDVAARQAGAFGHPDSWGEIEIASDQRYANPTFHCDAGVATAGKLHAAWIDRRDFPTQGLNVTTSERAVQPNLAPFVPDGWGGTLVASMVEGQRTTGWLAAGDTNFVSFAFINDGLSGITAGFRVALTVDGLERAAWTVSGGLPVGYYVTVEDHPLVAGAGPHTVAYIVDTQSAVTESNEGDNTHAESWNFVDGDPVLRFDPASLSHHCDPPALARADAMKLAAAPPLRREVHVPALDARLEKAVREAMPGERLRVMIVPAERVDAEALAKGLAGAGATDRRDAVVAALKAQSVRSEGALREACETEIREGRMTQPEPLWLSGSFSARMTPEAVARLASDPAIGMMWLDDVMSEPFGADASAGVSGAAAALPNAVAFGAAAAPLNAVAFGAAPPASTFATAWHLTKIGADQAWALGYDGGGVLVGHLDSGVAYDHPDLANQMWDGGATSPHHGYDAIDEDGDPYDGDTDWHHGTHTAGLIVGDGTGGTTTGAAPGAALMALRCVPGYHEDLVQAIQFGLDHGAMIFSFSAGWGQAAESIREANRFNAEVLLAAGIPWVCAAGNGDNAGGHYAVPTDISSPGDCPDPWYGAAGHSAVIAVGATDANDAVSATSSYGPTDWNITSTQGVYNDYPYPPGLVKPDIAAPGVNITSTTPPSGYVAYDGTSMATPLVAGASAILMQANPALLPPQLAEALEAGSVDLAGAPASAGRDNYTGAGRLNIPASIALLPATESETFWVHNDGTLPLTIEGVTWTAGWLTVSPAGGNVSPGDSLRFTAIFDPSGLVTGLYGDEIHFTTNDPSSPHLLPVILIVGEVVGVSPREGAPRPPLSVANHPNPFNPVTTIRFTLPAPAHAVLSIVDVTGRRVAVLADGRREAGEFTTTWNGKDEGGREVSSGIYFVRLEAGGFTATRKMSLVR